MNQRASLRDLIEAIPEEDWTPIPYWMDGAADVAETTYTPFQTKPDAAPFRHLLIPRLVTSGILTHQTPRIFRPEQVWRPWENKYPAKRRWSHLA